MRPNRGFSRSGVLALGITVLVALPWLPASGAPVKSNHALRVSSYLGGSALDFAETTAIDDEGNIYVAGYTTSDDFPTTEGAADREHDPGFEPAPYDGFVTKIDPSGSEVLYSTFLGGDSMDRIVDMDVDASGAVYVTGAALSSDFPTTDGAMDNSIRSADNVFLTKIAPDGKSFVYSALLGPGTPAGVEVDDGGYAYVVGDTRGTNYSSTPGVVQPQPRGNEDVFVSKVAPDGGSFAWSTFLGGREGERAGGIGIDPTGAVVVAGVTGSQDYPVTANAFQREPAENPQFVQDAFVTKLSPGGTALVYSTYLGGVDFEWEAAVAVDAGGSAFVVGSSSSPDFPTTRRAFQRTKESRRRGGDAFVVKFDPAGAVRYSTFVGGSGAENATAIDVADAGAVYFSGYTTSDDYPTTPGALKRRPGGNVDAFLTRLNRRGSAIEYSTLYGGWSQFENGNDVAVSGGRIAIAGPSYGPELPLAGRPFQREYGEGGDAFVAVFAPTTAVTADLVANGFEEGALRLVVGDTVQWHFASKARRSVYDTSGMNLFSSGNRGKEFHYAFTFFSAGRFVAFDSAASDRQRIAVPMQAAATSEGIHLRWATEVLEGYVFDVQVKTPGSTEFETIHEGTTALEATYDPQTEGEHRFRARLRVEAGGPFSGWSPGVAVEA